MTKLEKRRARFLQDPILVRIGGLAANLGRIASFSKNVDHQNVVDSVFQESKWFIEWTVADINIQQAAELVRLQIQLALWQLQANKKWHDEGWRSELAANSKKWSVRLLDMSGLLEAK